MALLYIAFNAQSVGMKQWVCFVNKRIKFFKSKRKQTELILCLNKAYRHNYGGRVCELHQPKDRSRGAKGEAGCLQASTPILSLPFLFHSHAQSYVHSDQGWHFPPFGQELITAPFFFVFRHNFPQAQTFQEAIPESTRIGGLPPHLETMQRALYYFRLQTTQQTLLYNK